MKNNSYSIITKYEWVLFYLLAILNFLPAIQVDFFPSLDGPAHLYNAKIINELIFSDSGFLKSFYAFNSEVVPNWGGHFTLAFLYCFFSAAMVNKIFIVLCLFLLPVSFRFCVKKINKNAIFAPYMIFPFVYTFMFCMGFYNFYVGLIILFTTIGFLIVYRENQIKIKYLIILFVLIGLGYLSHLFVFLSLGLYMFFSCSIDLLHALLKKENVKNVVKKASLLFSISLIPLCFTINYFSHSHGNNDKVYLLKTELIQWITNCRSLICYSVEDDIIYSTYIFFVIVFLFAIALYLRGKQGLSDYIENQSTIKSFFGKLKVHDSFLIVAGVFLLLYFKLPDSDSSAGFISSRLNLMFFLFLIIWISKFEYPKWISVIGFVVIFFSSYKLLKNHNEVFKSLNNEISEVLEIESVLKENKIILPLNYSNNWLTQHNSNYLGINKSVVILENYECNNTYFPLMWNCDEKMKELAWSNKSRFDEILAKIDSVTLNKVGYIFIQNWQGFPDSLRIKISESFLKTKQTSNYVLYEAKQQIAH